MNLKETGCESVHWVYLTRDAVQWGAYLKTVIKLGVLQKAENFLTNSKTAGF